MKQQIADKVAELVRVANQRYAKAMLPPPIYYDCNDTKGGYHKAGALHFNSILAAQNFDHYLTVTVSHETAHYVQWIVYPDSLTRKVVYRGYSPVYSRRKVHGREWQSIMRLFGIRDPERCHNYDVASVQKRVFKKTPVYCACSVHQVTNKIIAKLNAGRTFTCKDCKTKISLVNPLTSKEVPVSSLV